jgi:hypothetical protein
MPIHDAMPAMLQTPHSNGLAFAKQCRGAKARGYFSARLTTDPTGSVNPEIVFVGRPPAAMVEPMDHEGSA